MDINYKHLRYFWYVAKAGSISAACEQLHLTPQTISGQLKLLENSLGTTLFLREGRGLVLSEAGKHALDYAEQIFSLGSELAQSLQRQQRTSIPTFNVGIADVVPKLIAFRLLEPALGLSDPIRINCQEGTHDVLLGDLAIHKLDLILTDHPLESHLHVKAYSHLLGESDTSFFCLPQQAARYREHFPVSLDGAPMLMPAPGTQVQLGLKRWFDELCIQPRIVGEFADSALMNTFGQGGVGLFCAPSVIRSEVMRQFGVAEIGKTDRVRERFYALSTERRIRHPATLAVCEQGREGLFERRDAQN